MEMDKQFVVDYIWRDCNLKGGHFLMYDREHKKTVALIFNGQIPDDRLLPINEQEWAACVDMQTEEGEPYNLDFLVSDVNACPRIHGISIHQANGVPRYEWRKRDAVNWRQSPYWEPQAG